ncbi:hypothetical protein STCU_04503 [Strigomonas culicis]|uniref:Uncharacterized protein n=1 Tax=Strigomonas culicis TaxID=28005 RepID=S9UKS9_9TRYP|nr:hypothetical protein STCU_04503 [Strigomonas culicis]|eukprot:EPY29518.1 hypothetical protein STCU_04503 [Strigomonas culicis]
MGNFSSQSKPKVFVPDCTMIPERLQFEKDKVVTESVLIKFKGVDGYDVYNCSCPFTINGVRHVFGRVERRAEWVNSKVRLFKETGKDEFTFVDNSMIYELEDPYVQKIHDEMVFGGVCVTKNKGKCCDYFCNFYRGPIDDIKYFTAGPKKMKDIRLVQLADDRIGVFSHHKTATTCLTGFITIGSMDELSAEVIDSAVPIDHSAFGDAWGGVNQAYLLSTGKVGCISHHGYVKLDDTGAKVNVYCATSFVFEPSSSKVYAYKILATKTCFPPSEPKISPPR